jgi:hypothetical protein
MSHRDTPELRDGQKLTAKDGTETPVTTQEIAEYFHNEYEALAPSFGYETRPETRKFNPSSNNGCLMLSVADRVAEKYIRPLERESSELKAQIEGFRKDAERYRWLRNSHNQGANSPQGEGVMVVTDRPSKEPRYIGPLAWQLLDRAIDSALHHEQTAL